MNIKYYYKKLKSLTKDVGRKGFFHLLSSKVLLRLVGAISTILVVKWLTPEEMSQIATMRAITQIAFIVAGFGFNTSVLKLCSEARPLEEKAFLFKKNLSYTSTSIFAILLILYFLAKLSLLSPDETINRLMPYFMLTIPATVFLNLFVSFLQALKKIKDISKINIYARFVNLVGIIGLTYLFGLSGFITATVALGYIVLPFMYYYIKDLINQQKEVVNVFKLSFYLAKWSFAANSVHTLGRYMDVLLLNFLVIDRVEFGFYSIAALFMAPFQEITKTVRDIALPYFSEKQNNKKEFYRVLKKYKRLMLMLAIGVALAGAVLVPFAVKIIYGDSYSTTSIYFIIRLSSFIFHSNAAIISTAVIAVGMMRYNFFSSALFVPLSLILNYILISWLGVIGAAIAQSTASFFSMVLIIFISTRGLTKHFNEFESVKSSK